MIVIMIGLPGSGKTYHAERMASEHRQKGHKAVVVSADDYFTYPDGSYRWKAESLGNAHMYCLDVFDQGVRNLTTDDMIIVSNTNLTVRNRYPYTQIGGATGHSIRYVYVPCSVETSLARNVHNVPEAAIRAMASRLQLPDTYETVTDCGV